MTRLLPVAAAAFSGILVGSAIVATRFVLNQTGPGSLALLRYTIGFCCLLPPALLSGRVRFERRDLVPIALLGIVQFGVLVALLNYGLQFVPSARAALIFATTPLLTMLFAAALRYERVTPAKSAGVILTILGVGLALGEQVLQGGTAQGAGGQITAGWTGELAVLASATCAALCSVLYRPYLRKYPTPAVSAVAMLASLGFLAALAAGEGFFRSPPHFSASGWLAVVFVGASSGIGYYLWLWALNHTTPTKVTIFLALSPLAAAGLGAVWLGESISATFLAGLACVVIGLWLATQEILRPHFMLGS
jgi:drug/metabolite transporter (DMT)-like permease